MPDSAAEDRTGRVARGPRGAVFPVPKCTRGLDTQITPVNIGLFQQLPKFQIFFFFAVGIGEGEGSAAAAVLLLEHWVHTLSL